MTGAGAQSPATAMALGPDAIARRRRLGAWLGLAARLTFALLVVVLPFRARVDVLPHPAASLSATLSDIVIYAIDVLAVAVLGLWLVARILDRRPIALGPAAIRIPVAVILTLAWVTIPFGVEPVVSVMGALRISLGVLVAIYVLNEVEGLASLAVPIGLMLAIQAGVAIGQAVLGASVGLGAIGELDLDPLTSGTSVVTLANGERLLRAYALTMHPNILGGFLACGVLLLLGAGATSRPARVAQVAIVVLSAIALVASFSRGAWLGALVGGLAGLSILAVRGCRRDAGRWAMTAGVALAVALAAGWLARDAVTARTGLGPVVAATEQRSIDERLEQIRLGWRVVVERPLTGAGASALPIAMRDLEPDFRFSFFAPHLVALTVAGELGVAGGVAYVWMMAAPWALLVRARRRATLELAGASAALAALTVVSNFDDYPWVGGSGRTLAWLVLGLWVMAYGRLDRAPAELTTNAG